MYGLLLAVIYLAFIGLGLPDSLLGSGWPVMHSVLNVPLSYAGIISVVISIGTIISSLQSDRLTKRWGPGRVTAVSIFISALSLLGFSLSRSFLPLVFLALPYGLSAGAIDAALNNYVAVHYSSRHMNWLHCFWGVGTVISPFIMAHALTTPASWSGGYRIVALVLLGIALVLLATLGWWSRQTTGSDEAGAISRPLTMPQIFAIPRVKPLLAGFFGYCALEGTAILWAATYLNLNRGVPAVVAARYASIFLLGITVGRFLCGFVADRFGDRNMIRIGLALILLGILAVSLPIPQTILALNGLVLIGLGCAPIYPAIIHSTPANFGEENSQAIIGVQMAAAYTGFVVMPPLFGLLTNVFSVRLFPFYLLGLAVLIAVMTERVKIGTRNATSLVEESVSLPR